MKTPSWKVEPNQCPQSGSPDITYTESCYSDYKTVECEECEAMWVEQWSFVEFEMIEGVNNSKHIKEE